MKTENATKILSVLLNKIADHFGYLYARWQDEREYEDFKDYIESIRKKLKEAMPGAELLKVTKTFDITISVRNLPYNVLIQVRSTSIKFKGIAK